jgi:hypothetical protein
VPAREWHLAEAGAAGVFGAGVHGVDCKANGVRRKGEVTQSSQRPQRTQRGKNCMQM